MASRKIEDLHIDLQTIYTYASGEFKKQYPTSPQPFLTCTHRPDKEQNELYAQGRSVGKLGAIVTNAKAGQSPHNFKPALAMDIAFKNANQTLDWSSSLFIKFNKIIQAKFPNRVTFGGDFKFKDYPHYELKDWKALK